MTQPGIDLRPARPNNKHRYKRLSPRVLGPMILWDKHNVKYEEVRPVFNRDGYYYDRYVDVFWLESKGRAWIVDSPQRFFNELRRLNHKPLSEAERHAIQVLLHGGLAPQLLRDLYETDQSYRKSRRLWSQARLMLERTRKVST